MTDVTWKITNLDRQTSDGFVTTAHWTASAVDGDFSGSIVNTASFEGSPVVSYDSLTEADVLAWVWQSVDKEAVESALEVQIAEQKAPKIASGLPWGNE
jgi:hypothetical protein